MTLYALKPRFQDLLRPAVTALARAGVTPNAVTMAAAIGSVLVGSLTSRLAASRTIFLIVPVWLAIRIALNAIDGLLARDFHQQSVLGAYLNEIGDVVSDAALYAPFAFVWPSYAPAVVAVIVLSIVSEFAGALGPLVGAARRVDGPMGKSDRALVFGALGVWVGASGPVHGWLGWMLAALAVLLVVTTINRVRAGIDESEQGGAPC